MLYSVHVKKDSVEYKISAKYVACRAVGQRRWVVLFDGRKNGQIFDRVNQAARECASLDFDDEVYHVVRALLAEPGSVLQIATA
jgi:hypothetical protein